MDGTRHLIVTLLQEKGGASVNELAQELGLAAATVRRHLEILQRDRLVAFDEVRKSTGRPLYSYFLTDAGQEKLPKGYDRLLSLLLRKLSDLTPEELQDRNGSDLLETLFVRLGEEFIAPYQESLSDSSNGDGLDKRLATLMRVLTEGDFRPQMEVLEDGVRIKLNNCPFRSVSKENGAVCLYDQTLISGLLHAPVHNEQSIRNGAVSCCYMALTGK